MRYSDDDYERHVHGDASNQVGAVVLLFLIICSIALIWISRG